MDLTEKNKQHIDSLNYEQLLSQWRFAPAGSPWFQGDTGKYWGERMTEMRDRPGGDAKHTATSKKIGW